MFTHTLFKIEKHDDLHFCLYDELIVYKDILILLLNVFSMAQNQNIINENGILHRSNIGFEIKSSVIHIVIEYCSTS